MMARLVPELRRDTIAQADHAYQAVRSVADNDGATLDSATLVPYDHGHAVALRGTQTTIRGDRNAFGLWYADMRPFLLGSGNIGVWCEPNGEMELEVSVVCNTLARAAMIGVAQDQLCVYSIEQDLITDTYGTNMWHYLPDGETASDRRANMLEVSWEITPDYR